VWQWIRHGRSLQEGERVTADLVRRVADEELEQLDVAAGARELFEEVALGDELVEFLTLPAYERLG
jgi:malate synthase